MSTNIETTGIIDYSLAPTDQFQVTIDLTTWLDGDTIDTVTYTAEDEDGNDATDTVIDAVLSTNTDTQARAYIKGGVDGTVYTVTCKAVTTNGDIKSFYIKWICNE
jgi:endonuclease V-like protein UPF0215 family